MRFTTVLILVGNLVRSMPAPLPVGPPDNTITRHTYLDPNDAGNSHLGYAYEGYDPTTQKLNDAELREYSQAAYEQAWNAQGRKGSPILISVVQDAEGHKYIGSKPVPAGGKAEAFGRHLHSLANDPGGNTGHNYWLNQRLVANGKIPGSRNEAAGLVHAEDYSYIHANQVNPEIFDSQGRFKGGAVGAVYGRPRLHDTAGPVDNCGDGYFSSIPLPKCSEVATNLGVAYVKGPKGGRDDPGGVPHPIPAPVSAEDAAAMRNAQMNGRPIAPVNYQGLCRRKVVDSANPACGRTPKPKVPAKGESQLGSHKKVGANKMLVSHKKAGVHHGSNSQKLRGSHGVKKISEKGAIAKAASDSRMHKPVHRQGRTESKIRQTPPISPAHDSVSAAAGNKKARVGSTGHTVAGKPPNRLKSSEQQPALKENTQLGKKRQQQPAAKGKQPAAKGKQPAAKGKQPAAEGKHLAAVNGMQQPAAKEQKQPAHAKQPAHTTQTAYTKQPVSKQPISKQPIPKQSAPKKHVALKKQPAPRKQVAPKQKSAHMKRPAHTEQPAHTKQSAPNKQPAKKQPQHAPIPQQLHAGKNINAPRKDPASKAQPKTATADHISKPRALAKASQSAKAPGAKKFEAAHLAAQRSSIPNSVPKGRRRR